MARHARVHRGGELLVRGAQCLGCRGAGGEGSTVMLGKATLCAGIVGGSASREGGAEVAHAGSGSEVTRVDSGQEVIHARDGAEVAPACDGLEDTRARGVDGWRRVHGECGDARADNLQASGLLEGGALGSVFGRRQRATGPEEQHGQAQHERPIGVSDLSFVFVFTQPYNSSDFNISSLIARL